MAIEVNTDSNNSINIDVEAGQGNANVVLQSQSQAIGAIGTTALYGPKGDKGDKGDKGEQGIQGVKGDTGEAGYSPIATVSKYGTTTTITITDKSGTTTATVNDGIGSIVDVTVNDSSVVVDSVAKITVPTNNNQLINGAGYITDINSTDVVSALGYTPYNSTNPNGYTSNIGTVTSVNNIQPVNGNVALTIPTIDIDDTTITTNASDELQAVALIDNNTSNAIKTWTGTRAQYDAIVTKDSNTLYNIIDDTDVTLSLLELIYPVGAIYIGTMSTCPLAVLGVGTWVLKAADRVLQGAGTNTVGDTVEAGLPNITGGVNNVAFDSYVTSNVYGAFNSITDVGSATDGSSSLERHCDITFDASNSSSIYGNSSTVQPPAYIVNIWERIS